MERPTRRDPRSDVSGVVSVLVQASSPSILALKYKTLMTGYLMRVTLVVELFSVSKWGVCESPCYRDVFERGRFLYAWLSALCCGRKITAEDHQRWRRRLMSTV